MPIRKSYNNTCLFNRNIPKLSNSIVIHLINSIFFKHSIINIVIQLIYALSLIQIYKFCFGTYSVPYSFIKMIFCIFFILSVPLYPIHFDKRLMNIKSKPFWTQRNISINPVLKLFAKLIINHFIYSQRAIFINLHCNFIISYFFTMQYYCNKPDWIK